MIEESGRVIAVSDNEAWVQTLRQSACLSCAASKGCGQKLLNSLSSGRAQQIRVANVLGVRVGEEVIVGIPEAALLQASLVVYLVPLLVMVASAMVAQLGFNWPDGAVAAMAFVGLAAGFWFARWFSASHQQTSSYHPKLLRRQTAPASAIAQSTMIYSDCAPRHFD